jgi:CheY-like chemotaxis protein
MVKGMMMNGSTRRLFCPKCGWSNIRSSELVSFLDWVAKFAGLSPLRCRSCRLRFYRPWFLARRAFPLVTTHHSTLASRPARIALDPRYTSPIAVIPQGETTPVSLVPEGTILLLDDDPASRKLLRRLLDREGYVVREVSGASAALAELRGRGIDLAIINLNGHGGMAAVRTLRTAYPDLIVVVLSETAAHSEKSEKLVILPKPSRALVVLQNIRYLMSQDRRPEITQNVML